jgi:hypothetical protein
MTRFYHGRLKRALALPILNLPFLFQEQIGPAQVELLADRIEAA